MKWPLIARSTYDSLLERTQNVEKSYIVDVSKWQHRYDDLLERFVTLKREGFMEGPRPDFKPPPAPEGLPSEIREAIGERAGPGTPTERALSVYARRELDFEKDREDIIEDILEGGEYE